SLRSNKFWQAALYNTSTISSSVAVGLTNNKFSLIVPENNCVSCVTKPICGRNSSTSISTETILLYKISPSSGRYNPTNNFTSVVLPEPDGPTKAMVCPLLTSNEIFSTALVFAKRC